MLRSTRPARLGTSVALLACTLGSGSAGCAVTDEPDGDDPADVSATLAEATCAEAGDVYTPYPAASGYASGPVGSLAWRGLGAASPPWPYPDGVEDFGGYGPTLPRTVECASDKDRRSHLDVTAGCLVAVSTGGGAYQRGQVRATSDGSFRAVALGHADRDAALPVKWTDQVVAYRFFYREPSAEGANPGFKAFARYRSEDDLYVASWRFDGRVQIQRKLCGAYRILATAPDVGPPAPGVWHRLRFEASGDDLALYLDGRLALTAESHTFSWGTAGIRIDGADGSYLDDWSVLEP